MRLALLISGFIFLWNNQLDAQIIRDSTSNGNANWKPASLTLSTSLLDAGYFIFHPYLDALEFKGNLKISRYFITFENGWQSYDNNAGSNASYSSSGNYFRIGADVDFLNSKKKQHEFYLGLRYAFGSFSESLNGNGNDDLFGTFPVQIKTNNVQSSWFELLTGLRADLGRNIFMGYTFRWRFLPSYERIEGFSTYYMPGYGRISDASNIWFNYYIGYRIHFRKRPVNTIILNKVKKEAEKQLNLDQ